jgi:uncharacterized protein YuzE
MVAKTTANKKREVDKDMRKKEKPVVVNYDPSSDVLYVVTQEGEEEEFIEVSPGVNIELDAEGRVIGVEILNASETLSGIIETLYHKRQQVG